MIDAGPGRSSGAGGRLSPERLRRLGVSRIDLLILTHRHPDHVGGLHRLARDLPIGRCVRPRAPRSEERPWRDVASLLERVAGPCDRVSAGDGVRAGIFDLRVLGPEGIDGASGAWTDENARSLVGVLRASGVEIVLSGDAPVALERWAAPALALTPTGTARVLLVGHHGSATSSSSAWINAARADLAIVSHRRPMPAGVAARYRDAGVVLCGTSAGGTVRVDVHRGRIRAPVDCAWHSSPRIGVAAGK